MADIGWNEARASPRVPCTVRFPDLPGWIAPGTTVIEPEQAKREAIDIHLHEMMDDGTSRPPEFAMNSWSQSRCDPVTPRDVAALAMEAARRSWEMRAAASCPSSPISC